jgi:drug/metabolite transporter (DMT)-like permease
VAATSQATATILAAILAVTMRGDPNAGDFLWGVVGGIGGGAASIFLYYGLATGRMAVVAPLSALMAAALPVLVGLATGERPGPLAIAGVLLALPGIWLVSTSGTSLRGARRSDLISGLLAGCGFGVQFSSLGQIPAQAGFVPLAASQAVSVCAIVIGAICNSAQWLPRDRYSGLGAVAGLLAGIATICFQLATQRGLLAIVGVVASLYPAVTVMLAATVLAEKIERTQRIGLVCALASLILVASG